MCIQLSTYYKMFNLLMKLVENSLNLVPFILHLFYLLIEIYHLICFKCLNLLRRAILALEFIVETFVVNSVQLFLDNAENFVNSFLFTIKTATFFGSSNLMVINYVFWTCFNYIKSKIKK